MSDVEDSIEPPNAVPRPPVPGSPMAGCAVSADEYHPRHLSRKFRNETTRVDSRYRMPNQNERPQPLRCCTVALWLTLLRFPSRTQLLATGEDKCPGFLEVFENMTPFQGVARAATGHQIALMFSALVRPGKDEIHGHYQRVLETRHAIQPAVLANKVIAVQYVPTLFGGQGLATIFMVRKSSNILHLSMGRISVHYAPLGRGRHRW